MAPQVWTVLELLRWAEPWLTSRRVEQPRLDAEILLGHVTDLERVHLYTRFDQPLTADELASFKAVIKRRAAGEPVAYIVGYKEFWSMRFRVDRRVLIPRPDTETLVELARFRARQLVGEPRNELGPLSSLDASAMDYRHSGVEDDVPAIADQQQTPWVPPRRLRIADVGTGSGNIAVALARELPYADIIATDLSEDVLELARENAASLGHADQIEFRSGDMLEALWPDGPSSFDMIVSNPPYVAASELEHLPPEVATYEPRCALTPGPTGLEALQLLAQGAWKLLRPGGWMTCEIGHDQGKAASALFAAGPWLDVSAVRDRLSNQTRVVQARYSG